MVGFVCGYVCGCVRVCNIKRTGTLLRAAKKLVKAGCTAIAVVARFPDDGVCSVCVWGVCVRCVYLERKDIL